MSELEWGTAGDRAGNEAQILHSLQVQLRSFWLLNYLHCGLVVLQQNEGMVHQNRASRYQTIKRQHNEFETC